MQSVKPASNSPTDLELLVRHWRDGIASHEGFDSAALDELEDHLRSELAAISNDQLKAEERMLLAGRRVGKPAELAARYIENNRGRVWSRRLLWMIVGVLIVFMLSSVWNVLSYWGMYHNFALDWGTKSTAALFGFIALLTFVGLSWSLLWITRGGMAPPTSCGKVRSPMALLLGAALAVYLAANMALRAQMAYMNENWEQVTAWINQSPGAYNVQLQFWGTMSTGFIVTLAIVGLLLERRLRRDRRRA